MAKNIDSVISNCEFHLAKYKFIKENFPDAKVNRMDSYTPNFAEFSSRKVNTDYVKVSFSHQWRGLYMSPYLELDFEHGEISQRIKISSLPRNSRLVYPTYKMVDGKRVMKFSRLQFNIKNNRFRDDLLHQCRTEIIEYVQKHPNFHLDTKNLDPRLKNLISFI